MLRNLFHTNYHELPINSMRSPLYDQLHGNYMLKRNTNYHELPMNGYAQPLYDQLHGNYMLKGPPAEA